MAGLPGRSRGLARWEILLCSHTSSGGPVPAARPPTPAPLPLGPGALHMPRSQFRDTFCGFIPTVVTPDIMQHDACGRITTQKL